MTSVVSSYESVRFRRHPTRDANTRISCQVINLNVPTVCPRPRSELGRKRFTHLATVCIFVGERKLPLFLKPIFSENSIENSTLCPRFQHAPVQSSCIPMISPRVSTAFSVLSSLLPSELARLSRAPLPPTSLAYYHHRLNSVGKQNVLKEKHRWTKPNTLMSAWIRIEKAYMQRIASTSTV